MQTNKVSQEIYPKIIGTTINNHVVFSSLDQKDNTFNLDMIGPKIKNTKSREDYKASQVKNKVDQVNILDKISLHRQIREIIYCSLIQLVVNISKH